DPAGEQGADDAGHERAGAEDDEVRVGDGADAGREAGDHGPVEEPADRDPRRAAEDLPFAAHHAAVRQLGADVGRLVGDRKDRVGDAELDAERVDGLRERPLHPDQAAHEEIAQADAVELAFAEAVAEQVAQEAVVLGQRGEAVADVADLGDAEDPAELAAVAAVVGDADERGDVERIAGEAAEDLRLAGAAADAHHPFAARGRLSPARSDLLPHGPSLALNPAPRAVRYAYNR